MNNWLKGLMKNNQLVHVYQPIWDLNTWKIVGYESLIRVRNNSFVNVEMLFEGARNNNCLYELDTFAIENAIAGFPRFHFEKYLLFINVFPSTLFHEQFECFLLELVEKYPFIQGRIVFELNETICEERDWDTVKFKQRTSLLKNYRFYIAIDDVGKGICTLEKVNELHPDYIKIDREYANGLAKNQEKQKFLINLINSFPKNIVLILEGVETEIDLAQAMIIGIAIGQGFLLGKPEEL
jgi:EAL domain-containing protein (putative c-di-GMP-specific phosphodiesterase class I)